MYWLALLVQLKWLSLLCQGWKRMHIPGGISQIIVGLLGALGPFKIVLRFHVIDADVPTILGMPFLATINPKIDW